MDIYIARQPIFDRIGNIYGYELLYRRSMNNYYEGINSNQATADVINAAFFVVKFEELTSGTKGFINFSEHLILNEIPQILPKESVVIELLETINITEDVLKSCENLRQKGYSFALDDFDPDDIDNPLIRFADIIKIEFTKTPIPKQKAILKKYGENIKFLAEKVETREDFKLAKNLGYDLFQGYYFRKPVIIEGRDIDTVKEIMFSLISELNKQEPSIELLVSIFKQDTGLSYKLLKLSNSLFFGSKTKNKSIKSAIVRIGLEEMKRWTYVLLLKEIGNNDNKELLKNCVIRAKMMELICIAIHVENESFDFFITGMFSSIDVLLSQQMNHAIEGLGLTKDVQDALLGEPNEFRRILDVILTFEVADWIGMEKKGTQGLFEKLDVKSFTDIYIEALAWVNKIDWD